MPAVRDGQDVALVHLGPDIVPLVGQFGEGQQDIKNGQVLGHLLQPGDLLSDFFPDLKEKLVFQLVDPGLGSQHPVFVFLQLRGDKPFAVNQGLFPLVIGGHQRQVGLGYLNVIAKNLVVADLQRGDTRPFSLPFLNLGDQGLAGVTDLPQLIQLPVEACLDQASFLNQVGWLIQDGPVDQPGHILQVVPG